MSGAGVCRSCELVLFSVDGLSKMGVKCRFVLFDRMFSIEKAKIKCLMFRTLSPLATNYHFDLRSSRNINAVDLSHRQKKIDRFFCSALI